MAKVGSVVGHAVGFAFRYALHFIIPFWYSSLFHRYLLHSICLNEALEDEANESRDARRAFSTETVSVT
jgi:hypothetical protein